MCFGRLWRRANCGFPLAVIRRSGVVAKSELFSRATVREDDWREYQWTWCGRYSVPLGMLVAWNLQQVLGAPHDGGRDVHARACDVPGSLRPGAHDADRSGLF